MARAAAKRAGRRRANVLTDGSCHKERRPPLRAERGPHVTADRRVGTSRPWSDVASDVVERTLALADEGVTRLGGGSTSAEVQSWLEAESDVAEVQGDELAIRFRVDGGRGMWIYRPGAHLSGPSPQAAPAPANPPPPAREIVGDEGPDKKALVLSPALWQFTPQWDDGAEIKAVLESTRGYEGNVAYRKNEAETSTEVGPAAFTDWNDFDVVYYTGHGRRVCDLSGCRAGLEIGVLSTVITSGDSEAAKILQLDEMGLELAIGEETGNKYVLVAADFFRDAYPEGLDQTLVFLNGCQTVGDQALDLAEALRGGTSVVLGWSQAVYADDAIAASTSFFEMLSEQGYPAQVAWEKLGELRAGTAAQVGEVPELTFRPSPDGNDLIDESQIRRDGGLGDVGLQSHLLRLRLHGPGDHLRRDRRGLRYLVPGVRHLDDSGSVPGLHLHLRPVRDRLGGLRK